MENQLNSGSVTDKVNFAHEHLEKKIPIKQVFAKDEMHKKLPKKTPSQVQFTIAPEPVVNVKTPATTPAAKGQINSK